MHFPWEFVFLGLLLLLILGGFFIWLPLLLALQAQRRGYNGFLWFFAGFLSMNPLYPLILLSTLPHRARQRMRQQFRQGFLEKVRQQPQLVEPLPPTEEGPAATRDLSVGDQPTVAPEQRSLGDEATRL
jgi:hypothetical protein